jgi:putative oxidoreductase
VTGISPVWGLSRSSVHGSYWAVVQRLFSTFPNSWPGAGLVILRFAAGLSLFGIDYSTGSGGIGATLFHSVVLAVALMLLFGLGTPFAGVGAAVIHVATVILTKHYNSSVVVATALALALAMLGPGAWSLDALVFGRKRIV